MPSAAYIVASIALSLFFDIKTIGFEFEKAAAADVFSALASSAIIIIVSLILISTAVPR